MTEQRLFIAMWVAIAVVIGLLIWMGISAASHSPLLICPPGYTLTVYDTYDGVRQWCIPTSKQ